MSVTLRPYRHLQIFSVCLALLLVVLGVFLFAVRIERAAMGMGMILAADAREVFAPSGGKIRVSTEPAFFGCLDPGTIGKGVQNLLEIEPIEGGHWVLVRAGERADASPRSVMIVACEVRPGQSVTNGQRLLTLAGVRDEAGDLESPMVRAEFDEKQFGGIKIGQTVRIKSTMFPPRTHGHAEGTVKSLKPVGMTGDRGTRKFVAEIAVERSPFPMLYGGSVEVEVLLGRQETFRVILEH